MINSPSLSEKYGLPISLKTSVIDSQHNFFIEVDGNDIFLEIPLDFSAIDKSTPNLDDYLVGFYTKKKVKESEIKRLKNNDSDGVIGWIIPILSIESSEHEKSNLPGFLRYAFISLFALFKSYPKYGKVNIDALHQKPSVNLSQLFYDELVIVLIYKPMTSLADLQSLCSQLLDQGLVKLTERDPSEIKFIKSITEENTFNLKIKPISSLIKENILIEKVLHEQFPYESTPAFRFFILYQIVELLIEKVYFHQQEKLISDLIASKHDLSQAKDIFEKIQGFTSEKKRMTLLFDKYTSNNHDFSSLITISKSLLSGMNNDNEKSDIVSNLYPIRNFIVHNYRNFKTEHNSKLDELVEDILSYIPSILSNYHEPLVESTQI